ELYAPQLPLESAIARQGGFGDLGKRLVRELRYIHASGRNDGGEERPAAKGDAVELGERALVQLARLVERYDDPTMSYEVKPRRRFDCPLPLRRIRPPRPRR